MSVLVDETAQGTVYMVSMMGLILSRPIYVAVKYPDPMALCDCKHVAGKKGKGKDGTPWEMPACLFLSERPDDEHVYDWKKRRWEQCKTICKHAPNCIVVAGIPPFLPPDDREWVQSRSNPQYWHLIENYNQVTAAGIPNPAYDRLAWRPKTA